MSGEALVRALGEVAEAMRPARDPWWLIGSAAMALHGAPVSVADIDLMVSVGDADRLFGACVRPGAETALFRSMRHGGWDAAGVTVDLMAELEVCRDGRWLPVRPTGREAIRMGEHLLFTPGVEQLLAMCRLFDRPKDRERTILLSRMSPLGDMSPARYAARIAAIASAIAV